MSLEKHVKDRLKEATYVSFHGKGLFGNDYEVRDIEELSKES